MNNIAIDDLLSKKWLKKQCRTSFEYNQNWKKSQKSYKCTNWKRAYKAKSFKMGTDYEQNIVIKLEFIREHF